MRRPATALATALVLILGLSACATPKGTTVEDRRQYVQAMQAETLERFYRADPSLRQRIEGAIGYGVFSNLSLRLFAVGAGHGYGLAHNNLTGDETYMRMAQVGAGFGVGVMDFSALFVFNDAETLHSFVDSGWQFGAGAEASAIANGDQGLSLGTQAEIAGGQAAASGAGIAGLGSAPPSKAGSTGGKLEVYRLTKNGIALRADVAGTKYWKDGALNGSGSPRASAPADVAAFR